MADGWRQRSSALGRGPREGGSRSTEEAAGGQGRSSASEHRGGSRWPGEELGIRAQRRQQATRGGAQRQGAEEAAGGEVEGSSGLGGDRAERVARVADRAGGRGREGGKGGREGSGERRREQEGPASRGGAQISGRPGMVEPREVSRAVAPRGAEVEKAAEAVAPRSTRGGDGRAVEARSPASGWPGARPMVVG